MNIPRITVRLNEKQLLELEDDVKEIMQVVRPNWTSQSIWTKLIAKTFTDGVTNKLIGYFLEEAPRDVLIFKIYGLRTEDIIDRDAEVKTMKFLHERRMGPNIYGLFDNGIVYEFIPGKTLDTSSCRDPKIYPLVAAKMAKLHSIPIEEAPSTNQSAFWDKLNTFLSLANVILRTNSIISQKYADFGLTIHWTTASTQLLRTRIATLHMPYAFCHNDILLPNIIFDDMTSTISFIDYEYAFINYAPFDVANHFNEFSGIEDADFSRCPDEAFMSCWIQEYLKHFQNGTSGFSVTEFQQWVNLCIPLSHLFWILWTVVQAQNSTIDFDYVMYGKKRFIEFEKWTTLENGAI